ncbi:hypothetical protein I317_00916 [Kwoniella heveanensis CBS 569]|nr:hypothetical protein I317_00916 [Kwoniella heveanensis CBS 569]
MTSSNNKHSILLGTHEKHIHSVIFDSEARTLTRGASTARPEQPSWLIRHPVHPNIIYSNAWVDNKLYVHRLKGEDGSLELLGEADSGGEGPTHFAVLPGNKELVVAHYRSGSISVIPLEPSGLFAAPSPAPHRIFKTTYSPLKHYRQEAAHVHQVVLHDNEILTPDLGANKVWRWKWNAGADEGKGKLELVGEISEGLEDGDGPRHLVVHPSGSHVYVLNEVSSSLTVHTLPAPGSGELSRLVKRFSMLPPSDDKANDRPTGGAEIILLPPCTSRADAGAEDGSMLLLCSNRDTPVAGQEDTIALFKVSPTNGGQVERTKAGWLGGIGKHIRAVEKDNFTKDGRFVCVASRDEGRVVILERVDDEDGEGKGLGLKAVASLDGIEKVVVPLWI